MNKRYLVLFSLLVLAALTLGACSSAAGDGEKVVETVIVTVQVPVEVTSSAPAPAAPSGYGETLKTVQARGRLICGVNAQVPGFGYVSADGSYQGFDVEYCQAIAAAIFGDPTKVEYRSVTASERFTALQSGEIDVLIRNTTWTLSRDTELAGNFVGTTFYDGQGMMVPADSGLTTLEDLEGGTICVQTGTTTELNLADVMAALGVSYTPAVFDDADGTFAAYSEERCDAVTTDKSGLVSRRSVLANPENHIIMDVTMSKEPLGPMVRHGDDQWFDIVKWTVFATMAAEEYGVSSANVDEVRNSSENPEVKRLLGVEGELGGMLGLGQDWSYNIIKLVGNYGEIYDRNLGPDTPTYVPRGANNLYTEGGLHYAPPIR